MFERILVPLDGSEGAEAALAVATALPSRTLDLLSVQPDCTEFDEVCRSQKVGSDYLQEMAEPLRHRGRDVETHVAYGDPGPQIVAFSAPADLVVIGSEGRGATGQWLLGSVADWVARHAPVPTMIVRGGQRPAAVISPSRVVVALDGSSLAETALPVAERFAANLGRPIHLVRVVDGDPTRAAVQAGVPAASAWADSQEDASRQADAYLAKHAQALRDRGVTASYELRTGPTASALMNAVHDGDVLVLTTRSRSGLARWLLGSVADEVVRHAPVPVVVVPATQRDSSPDDGDGTLPQAAQPAGPGTINEEA